MAFDCIIGYQSPDASEESVRPMVTEQYLRTLVTVANQRFNTNAERRERFRENLLKPPKQ